VKPLFQLHLLVVLFALTGIVGRVMEMPAPALVAWRTALAGLAAAAWIVWVQRRALVPSRRAIVVMLGVGAVVGVHWICFFGAIQLANVTVAMAGMASISLFTAFTEPWIEKRRLRPVEILLGLLVLGGIAMVAGSARDHLAGLGVALLGALLAAVFPVLNRRLVRGHPPLTIVAWEMPGACLVGLAAVPFAGGFGGSFVPCPADFGWLLFLALACTVFAHAFHVHLLRSLTAYTSNLAINFEPVYGMLLAAWLFHEHRLLSPAFYLGAATIVAANLLHPLALRAARRPR